jgi:putative transposase
MPVSSRNWCVSIRTDELERFGQQSNGKCAQIAKSCTTHWVNVRTLFDYPSEIRKAIYTPNIIESLNSVIRCAVAHRKLLPIDESAMKVIYLTISQAAKKWNMPIQNWRMTLNRFMIQFEVRIQKYDH